MSETAARNPANRGNDKTFGKIAARLVAIGREFHARGWALGTSGNFSAVLSEKPLRLAITPTGMDKGTLKPRHILQIEASGRTLKGVGVSSTDTPLHLAVVQASGAGAVLHTHSVWSTVLSLEFAGQGGIALEGYNLLKGLEGVRTPEHREWLPILENSPDMAALAARVRRTLQDHPIAHGFLLPGHGLYSWGRDLAAAKRHVEILEFLLEVLGRQLSMQTRTRPSSGM